jgi:hypothetical protein
MGMLFASPTRAPEPKEAQHAHVPFWQKTLDDPVAAFTAVLAVSTILLWWVTWQTGRRQSQETKILQRAYVSVEPRGTHLMKDAGQMIAHVAIKNAGNLPATNLSWFIDIRYSSSGEDVDFPLKATKGNIVVVPQSDTTRGSDRALTSAM